jgi:hypothetical protein
LPAGRSRSNGALVLRRVERDAAIGCAAAAIAAAAWRPDHLRLAAGVVGGGVLVGVAYWAIRGAVAQLTMVGENGEIRPVSRVLPLVKFFTRHVILAVGAYVMMVRLHLDPVGMLIGVTSVVVAAAVAAGRRPREAPHK